MHEAAPNELYCPTAQAKQLEANTDPEIGL